MIDEHFPSISSDDADKYLVSHVEIFSVENTVLLESFKILEISSFLLLSLVNGKEMVKS